MADTEEGTELSRTRAGYITGPSQDLAFLPSVDRLGGAGHRDARSPWGAILPGPGQRLVASGCQTFSPHARHGIGGRAEHEVVILRYSSNGAARRPVQVNRTPRPRRMHRGDEADPILSRNARTVGTALAPG